MANVVCGMTIFLRI